MKDVREILAELNSGMGSLAGSNPAAWETFSNFCGQALADGVVPAKYKELIAIGIAVYSRCEYCIVAHANAALKAGCTRQEILEAATAATAFGGGPTMAYSSAVLVAALDELEKDFA